jgi:hypothetical protein
VWEAIGRLITSASAVRSIGQRLQQERQASDAARLVHALQLVLEHGTAALFVVRVELGEELAAEQARRQTPFGGGR